jgi:hypothetical protein
MNHRGNPEPAATAEQEAMKDRREIGTFLAEEWSFMAVILAKHRGQHKRGVVLPVWIFATFFCLFSASP